MPWIVSNQPRSGSRESPGPSAKGSMAGTQKKGTRQGPWVRALDPEERCVGVGVHNKSLKPAGIPNFSTGGREADGSRMATNTPPLM